MKDDLVGATFMGGKRSTCRVLVGTPDGKKRLGDVDVYEMIILKWAIKYDGRTWTGLIFISIGTCGGGGVVVNTVINFRVL
jgi:hypothetical protein